jgi:leucyl-tRNA synthetase
MTKANERSKPETPENTASRKSGNDHNEIENEVASEVGEPTLYKLEPGTAPGYASWRCFPYPSGTPYVGHLRNYAIGDNAAKWMQFQCAAPPCYWDAFGLPPRTRAIKNNRHPREWTL